MKYGYTKNAYNVNWILEYDWVNKHLFCFDLFIFKIKNKINDLLIILFFQFSPTETNWVWRYVLFAASLRISVGAFPWRIRLE